MIAAQVAEDLLGGQVAAGARAIRWIDDGDRRGREVVQAIYPRTGRAHIVGVTGPPGAGKSTLVDMIVTEQRQRGRTVGVIAIDPTSPFSGGAILGDRVRMQRHAVDPGVFIRSMGSRGAAGGLSRASYEACLVLDAMGFDVIIVETVGVGQDEIDVVRLAHTTVIVSVPGLGDEVQALKAGLLEAGEVFVINKADREGAEETRRQLELMLHLRSVAPRPQAADWSPPLLMTIATRQEGAADLVDALDAHLAHLRSTGGFARQTGERAHHAFLERLREGVLERLSTAPAVRLVADQLRAGQGDPYAAADTVLETLEAIR